MTGFVQTASDFSDAKLEIQRRGWPLHRWNELKNWDSTWLDYVMRDGDFLDIGCATSMPLFIFSHLGLKGEMFGIDPHLDYPFVKPADAEFLTAKAELLPFENDSFDNITCLSVIEHGVDLFNFVSEIQRVLRPEGRFVITFDFWPCPTTDCEMITWDTLIKLRDYLVCFGFVNEPMNYKVNEKTIDGLYTFGAMRGFLK